MRDRDRPHLAARPHRLERRVVDERDHVPEDVPLPGLEQEHPLPDRERGLDADPEHPGVLAHARSGARARALPASSSAGRRARRTGARPRRSRRRSAARRSRRTGSRRCSRSSSRSGREPEDRATARGREELTGAVLAEGGEIRDLEVLAPQPTRLAVDDREAPDVPAAVVAVDVATAERAVGATVDVAAGDRAALVVGVLARSD